MHSQMPTGNACSVATPFLDSINVSPKGMSRRAVLLQEAA